MLIPRLLTSLLIIVQFSVACGDAATSAPAVVNAGPTPASPTAEAAESNDAENLGSSTVSSSEAEVPNASVTPLADEEATDPGAPPTAVEAAAAMARGVNLGQMFESTQHPRSLAAAKAKIDAYYERGYRNLRVPVTWTEDVGGDTLVNDPTIGDIKREHPRLKVIEDVVDYALSKPGLYVVLDAHHEHALKTQARSAVLERLWSDIADIFSARDHRLIFEILNEPHNDDTTPMAAATLREMTGLAYNKIRAVDKKRIVIIGGNQWFGAQEVPQVWTTLEDVGGGRDAYVMATFHHYNPWSFCGDDQGDYADAWTEDHLKNPMQQMEDWAQSTGQGMPVYIGEWGVGWGSRYDSMSCNNIRQWYSAFTEEAEGPRGMPTSLWDDGGWFKVFDHASESFDNNLIDCLDGDCMWDGESRYNSGCN